MADKPRDVTIEKIEAESQWAGKEGPMFTTEVRFQGSDKVWKIHRPGAVSDLREGITVKGWPNSEKGTFSVAKDWQPEAAAWDETFSPEDPFVDNGSNDPPPAAQLEGRSATGLPRPSKERLTERDSIERQVAFKGAIEVLKPHYEKASDDQFASELKRLTEVGHEAIRGD